MAAPPMTCNMKGLRAMAITERAGLGATLAVAASIAGILGTAHEYGFFSSPASGHITPAPPTPSRTYPGVVMTTPGYRAKVFLTPSLRAPAQGSLTNGASVSIECTVEGDVVTFGGNSSSLWNRISSHGYLPDVHVNTGSAQPTMPKC